MKVKRAASRPAARGAKSTTVLRPRRLVDASQAWFWTPEWQKMEREADADIKAGRVKSFSSVEDLIAELHR